MTSEHKPPTHYLRVEVPINVDAGTTLDFDGMAHAVKIIVALSHVAVLGYICGGANVTLDEVTPPDPDVVHDPADPR